jgi:hypothetical protein
MRGEYRTHRSVSSTVAPPSGWQVAQAGQDSGDRRAMPHSGSGGHRGWRMAGAISKPANHPGRSPSSTAARRSSTSAEIRSACAYSMPTCSPNLAASGPRRDPGPATAGPPQSRRARSPNSHPQSDTLRWYLTDRPDGGWSTGRAALGRQVDPLTRYGPCRSRAVPSAKSHCAFVHLLTTWSHVIDRRRPGGGWCAADRWPASAAATEPELPAVVGRVGCFVLHTGMLLQHGLFHRVLRGCQTQRRVLAW